MTKAVSGVVQHRPCLFKLRSQAFHALQELRSRLVAFARRSYLLYLLLVSLDAFDFTVDKLDVIVDFGDSNSMRKYIQSRGRDRRAGFTESRGGLGAFSNQRNLIQPSVVGAHGGRLLSERSISSRNLKEVIERTSESFGGVKVDVSAEL